MRNYYMIIPFVAAIIQDEKDQILIGKHSKNDDKPYPGRWDLPAGKLRENENFEECLVREIKEETGFDVIDVEMYKVHHNNGEDMPENKIPAVGVCYKVQVSGDFIPQELEDMHFAHIDKIKNLSLTPWAQYFLEEYL